MQRPHAIRRDTFRPAVLGAILILITSSAVRATLVDVDYKYSNDPVASGAAVLGSAGDQWNPISDPSATALTDVNGDPSGITESWTGDGTIVAANLDVQVKPDLMNDYIFTNDPNAGISVSLQGLVANLPYEVVLYTASNDASTSDRSMTGDINGVPFTAFGNPEPSFVAGQNYVDVITAADSSGNIAVTISDLPVTNFSGEVDLNGLQIQPLPEPATLSLLALSAVPLLRRRTMQKN